MSEGPDAVCELMIALWTETIQIHFKARQEISQVEHVMELGLTEVIEIHVTAVVLLYELHQALCLGIRSVAALEDADDPCEANESRYLLLELGLRHKLRIAQSEQARD